MKKIIFFITLISLATFTCSVVFAEQITITTYYPAPYGVYKDLQAETLTVNNNDQQVFIGDLNNPGITIEDVLGSGTIPYISFIGGGSISTIPGTPVNYKISLDNDVLTIKGGFSPGGVIPFSGVSFLTADGKPATIRTGETWFCAP